MATYIPGGQTYIPNIEPFQPDWGMVDRTFRLKQSTYDQNYSALQSTYSNLLSMPQLKQDQINKRDKFIQQAFKNLGDLASVDLSLPENISAAQNVFAPLYQDTEFLGNSAVSKHFEKQEQIADGFRLADGGKQYSQDNIAYVRKQRNEYMNDPNSANWRQYYSNKRSYEPYYNTNQEIREAMEKFKPSSVSYTKLNGMYMVKTDDKSWREQEIKTYLNGVLSDKAKRQLQIEADVRLGNTDTILSYYKDSAKKDLAFNNAKINEINTAINNARNPQEREQLQNAKIQYDRMNADINSELEKINKGDIGFIKSNQEALAYKMYYNGVIDKTAKAFAHKDYKEDITENTVAFGMWKDGQQWARLRFTEANTNRRHRETLAAQAAKDAKEIGDPLVTTIPSGPADKVNPKTLGTVDTDIQVGRAAISQLSDNLKKHVAVLDGVSDYRKVSDQRMAEYMRSVKGSADPAVKNFIEQSKVHQLKIDDAENEKNQAFNYALSKMGEGYNPSSGTYRQNRNSPIDMSKALFKNTQPFNGLANPSQNRAITDAQARAQRDMAAKNRIKFNALQEEYFGTEQARLNKGLVFADNDPRVKSTKQYLTSITGVEPTKLREVTFGTRNDNQIRFSIDDVNDKNKIDRDELRNKLSGKGFETEILEDGSIVINNSRIAPGLNPFSSLNPFARQLVNTLDSRIGLDGTQYQSPYFNFNVPNSDKSKFRIDKHFDGINSSYYLYREKNGKAVPLSSRFSSAMDAYKFAEDQALNPERADILFNR